MWGSSGGVCVGVGVVCRGGGGGKGVGYLSWCICDLGLISPSAKKCHADAYLSRLSVWPIRLIDIVSVQKQRKGVVFLELV